MPETTFCPRSASVELTASAPLVRITAGAGSPAQKTWNLRRPVTLIGSGRPSVIVLHDRDVSKAHCVIVNTGSDVLLKDLHTPAGTYCNKERVDLVALKDGDVVTVGGMSLQIAIQVPKDRSEDSGYDLEYVDPRKFPKPIQLSLDHTTQKWHVEDAVALIGKCKQAALCLDHEGISNRHAILFRFGRMPAIFDLGSRNGLSVNGAVCGLARLRNGDRIGIGPLALVVEGCSENPKAASSLFSVKRDEPSPTGDVLRDLSDIAAELEALQTNIGASWDRLNTWTPREAPETAQASSALDARVASLDARDAMLRGHMHDITRYHDELYARERDLAAQLANIQAQRDEGTSAEKALEQRALELDKRSDELKRREHVLAQRWARLNGLACPHCGKGFVLRS